jgi:hypothetical protein
VCLTDAGLDALALLIGCLKTARGRPVTVDSARRRLGAMKAAHAALEAAGERLGTVLFAELVADAQKVLADLETQAAERAEAKRRADEQGLDEARGYCSAGGQRFLDLDGGISALTLQQWLADLEAWAWERC